jgi:hypothetical protein
MAKSPIHNIDDDPDMVSDVRQEPQALLTVQRQQTNPWQAVLQKSPFLPPLVVACAVCIALLPMELGFLKIVLPVALASGILTWLIDVIADRRQPPAYDSGLPGSNGNPVELWWIGAVVFGLVGCLLSLGIMVTVASGKAIAADYIYGPLCVGCALGLAYMCILGSRKP